MGHETKHEDHKRRNVEVANLWRILGRVKSQQNLKSGNTSFLKRKETKSRARSNACLGLGEEEGGLIYRRPISTVWWQKPVLELST